MLGKSWMKIGRDLYRGQGLGSHGKGAIWGLKGDSVLEGPISCCCVMPSVENPSAQEAILPQLPESCHHSVEGTQNRTSCWRDLKTQTTPLESQNQNTDRKAGVSSDAGAEKHKQRVRWRCTETGYIKRKERNTEGVELSGWSTDTLNSLWPNFKSSCSAPKLLPLPEVLGKQTKIFCLYPRYLM